MKDLKALLGSLTMVAVTAFTLGSCAHVTRVMDFNKVPLNLEISSVEKILVNDTLQWIYIAGTNVDNPVLLWLDGGPGGAEVGWVRTYLGPLHERFTIVCWDQRGTAKSFSAGKKTDTVETYVEDVIALSRMLAIRFGKNKIYLAGHSWGSIIGLMAARREASLYEAYIGIGQQINGIENDRIGWNMVLEGAKAEKNDSLVKKLLKNGPPPYTDGQKYLDFFSKLYQYSPHPVPANEFDSLSLFFAKEHTPMDRINHFRGLYNGVKRIYPQVGELDFERDIQKINCPVYIVAGRYDRTCVSEIAERWFNSLDAPKKGFIWFEQSGHNPCYTERERFIRYLTEVVLQ